MSFTKACSLKFLMWRNCGIPCLSPETASWPPLLAVIDTEITWPSGKHGMVYWHGPEDREVGRIDPGSKDIYCLHHVQVLRENTCTHTQCPWWAQKSNCTLKPEEAARGIYTLQIILGTHLLTAKVLEVKSFTSLSKSPQIADLFSEGKNKGKICLFSFTKAHTFYCSGTPQFIIF